MLSIISQFIKYFFWKSIKKLANLNLSIFVLFLIAFCCMLGSILEQDQSYSYYNLNYFNYASFITFLGLDHIFYTWWFIFLLVLFNVSLLSCTVFTQLPALKNARRWKFVYNINYLDTNISIDSNYFISGHSLVNAIYSLIRLDFFVFCRNYSLYAYKGLYGRFSPIFVHISIVAILIGSVYSSVSSFVVQELIPSGETFHIKNIIHSGLISNLPSDLLLYIDNFYIDYNLDQSIKQFFSSIRTYSNYTKKSTLNLAFVNKPIRFNHLTIYQANWKIDAIRLILGKNYFVQRQLFASSFNGKKCWLTGFFLNNKDKVFLVILNLDNKVLLCDSKGSILYEVLVGTDFYVNNIPITIKEIISSTGLQIKYDSGILIVYFGFLVMMISTIVSYISYSEVWISVNLSKLKFSGCTNRATLLFETDIMKLRKIYFYYSTLNINFFNKTNHVLR